MNRESTQKNRLALYGIVVAILVASALFWFMSDRGEPGIPLDGSQKEKTVVSTTTLALIEHNRNALELLTSSSSIVAATANWQEYIDRDAGFSFKYPTTDFIQLTEGDEFYGIFLQRPISFETYDACDLKGGPDIKMLTEIPDFELGIRFENISLRDVLVKENHAFREAFVSRDWPGIYEADEDAVDAFLAGTTSQTTVVSLWGGDEKPIVSNIGPFKGFYKFTGFEGCGGESYYVPLEYNATLIVQLPFLFDSLNPIGSNPEAQERFGKIQSQYPPIDPKKLIYQILSTFRLLEQ